MSIRLKKLTTYFAFSFFTCMSHKDKKKVITKQATTYP